MQTKAWRKKHAKISTKAIKWFHNFEHTQVVAVEVISSIVKN